MILISMPDLQFYHKLFSEVIHDYIRSPLIPRLGFQVIISHTVNDRLSIQQEKLSPVSLNKLFVVLSINIREMLRRLFQQQLHIQFSMADELISVLLPIATSPAPAADHPGDILSHRRCALLPGGLFVSRSCRTKKYIQDLVEFNPKTILYLVYLILIATAP